MSDCVKDSYRSKDASAERSLGCNDRDLWQGKPDLWQGRSELCKGPDTSVGHLPDFSIAGDQGSNVCDSRSKKRTAPSGDHQHQSKDHSKDHSHHNHHSAHHHSKIDFAPSLLGDRQPPWLKSDSDSEPSSGCGIGKAGDKAVAPSETRGWTAPGVPADRGPADATYTDVLPTTPTADTNAIEQPIDKPVYLAPKPAEGGWSSVVASASISELTQLSEQLLPVHANGSYPTTAAWESLHAANVKKAANAAQSGSNIEFFGDSITEAMGYNPAAMEPFNQAFSAGKPTALGIGGDGTAQLLYRLNHGEMQGQPKVAVLMIGTNDIGSLSPAEIAENTAKSIESIQLRSPNTKVMVMGVLPRPEAGDPGNFNVDATNEALSRLATANGDVEFTNLRNSFVDARGNQKTELYQPDKLHLTPAGYQAWADGLKGRLARMLSSPSVQTNPGDNSATSNSGASNSNDNNFNANNSGINDSAANNSGTSDTPISNSPLTTLDTGAIRGVNLSGAEWGKNNNADSQFWPTTEELDYYKSKGMNTFRLMLSWEQFQPTLNGPLDPSEMTRLHNFLQEADERGLKVLVTGGSFARYTLNHGPNGQGADGEVNGTVVGEAGVPVSAMQDFWMKMVRHIDADPSASRAVGGWDLTNEPHDVGGTWPATATAVTQAIRSVGDNHTVVIEGDQWATDFRGLEALAKSDKNVAFEAHTYWDTGSGAYLNPNPPADNPNIGVDKIRPFVSWLDQNDAQGFVGEWGVPTNNTAWAPAVSNFIEYLNDNDIGNMVWAGGPGWKPDYKLSVEPLNGQDRPIMATIVEANQS
ncbi:MAG: cellulase family glycosylhydrolase [Candidatus Obscuribacterales bacterium]